MRTNHAFARFVGALAALAALTAPAAAEPFVYQGRLNDGAQPADGDYDIRAELYTAPTGGTPASSNIFDNVTVTEGVFSITLPFPPSVAARWISIAVRPGASASAFTTLEPRQHIAAGPFASYALNAPWVLNGSTMSYGDGDDIVLINRTNRIGSEYFGVHADTSGFAGIYVSTTPSDGQPFYGYSVADDINAYHYFNGFDSTWYLFVNGQNRLAIDSARAHFQSVPVLAPDYSYESPKSRTFSISGNTFMCVSGDAALAYTAGGNGAYTTSTDGLAWFVAPVNLPDGAVITSFKAYAVDNSSGGSIDFLLNANEIINGNNISLATRTTGALPNSSLVRELSVAFTHTADNNRYAYFVVALINTPPGNNTLRISGARVTYTVTKPD